MLPPYSFGTGDNRVWFRVLHEGDRLPAWTSPQVTARTFVFPGSVPPRSETQIVSIGVSTLTWRLSFPSLDDFWRMLARLGNVDTLMVPAHVQSHRGTEHIVNNQLMVDLPGTLLLALDADTPDPDGRIEAVATFQRHIDPATGWMVPS